MLPNTNIVNLSLGANVPAVAGVPQITGSTMPPWQSIGRLAALTD